MDILPSNESDTRTYWPYITGLIVKIYSQYGVRQNTTTWKRYKIINIQWLTNLVLALSPLPFWLSLQTESFKQPSQTKKKITLELWGSDLLARKIYPMPVCVCWNQYANALKLHEKQKSLQISHLMKLL